MRKLLTLILLTLVLTGAGPLASAWEREAFRAIKDLAREQTEQAKAAKEKAAKEQAEREKAEQERAEQAAKEQKRIADGPAEWEKKKQEREAKEQAARERERAENAARAAKARAQKEQAKREKAERWAKKRAELAKREQERIAREQARAAIEQAAIEQERAASETATWLDNFRGAKKEECKNLHGEIKAWWKKKDAEYETGLKAYIGAELLQIKREELSSELMALPSRFSPLGREKQAKIDETNKQDRELGDERSLAQYRAERAWVQFQLHYAKGEELNCKAFVSEKMSGWLIGNSVRQWFGSLKNPNGYLQCREEMEEEMKKRDMAELEKFFYCLHIY